MRSQLSLAATTLSFALGALAGKEFWLVEKSLQGNAAQAPPPQLTPFADPDFSDDKVVVQENFIKNDDKGFVCESLQSVEDWSIAAGMAKTKYNYGVDHDVWRFYAWTATALDFTYDSGIFGKTTLSSSFPFHLYIRHFPRQVVLVTLWLTSSVVWEEDPNTPNGEGTLAKQGTDLKGHCKREDDPQAAGVRQVCKEADGTEYVYSGTLHCWID